jgi:hypothetical protein
VGNALPDFKRAILVSEQKILTWLRYVCFLFVWYVNFIINLTLPNIFRFDILKRNPNLKYESIDQEIKAILDLWKEQNTGHITHFPYPGQGIFLKAFKKRFKMRTAQLAIESYEDKATGTLKDGYDEKDLKKIIQTLLAQENGAQCQKNPYESRLLFLLLHMFMSRSEDLCEPRGMLSDFMLRSVCILYHSFTKYQLNKLHLLTPTLTHFSMMMSAQCQ